MQIPDSDNQMRLSWKVNALTGTIARALARPLALSVKSFIFCASTGRSGTNTLERLLVTVPRCMAKHEPHPAMNGNVLVRYNEGDDRFVRRIFYYRKLPQIYWDARGRLWYAETNHQFIKCFAHLAAEAFGRRLQVIHLRRDPDAVATSFLARGSIPGTPYGNQWLIDYRAPRNEIRLERELGEGGPYAHPYFRILWYWYEIEARTRIFSKKFPFVPVHFIETEQLNDRETVQRLFGALGLPVTEATLAAVGSRANAAGRANPPPQGVTAGQIQAFHALCREHLEAVSPPPAPGARQTV